MQQRIDERVLEVQKWLNTTYGKYEEAGRFFKVIENGKTGWNTIFGLRRALQIELGILETSDNFGETTYNLCQPVTLGEENNIVYIIQGGLWCKGYNPGGFTGHYGNGTYNAVKSLKRDAGFPDASGNMQRDFMRALLDMSAFVCVEGGNETIRAIQQELNYEYYDYYQISPCDGVYGREMNKMLIYALQKEIGIPQDNATGEWGPRIAAGCPTIILGQANNFVRLVRYALICNGFSQTKISSVYDIILDILLGDFASTLEIDKTMCVIDYTLIKSLLSSNGETSRVANGCDTSTRLD